MYAKATAGRYSSRAIRARLRTHSRSAPTMGCQRKRCEPRRDGAGFLAAVAVLGLIVTPLLHAEAHCNEAHEADGAALARQWESESKDPSDALASALARVHGTPRRA